VQRQIRAGISAAHPTIDAPALSSQRLGHGFFSYFPIRPGGGSGNVALAAQPFAKLLVGPRHVPLQRVPAALFVFAEVIAFRCAASAC
jgi:hypothetical protein